MGQKAAKVGTCRLCLEDTDALRRSHIVPEWCFRQLYEPAAKGSGQEALRYVQGQTKIKPIQQGDREHLLCERCEQHIGDFEKYFKRAWIDEGRCPQGSANGGHVVTGMEYRRTKLFLLSVFWRASVATIAPYAPIDLGVKHQDRIRRMLLDGDAGPVDRYPIQAYLAHLEGQVEMPIEYPRGRARLPDPLRTSFYRMIFAGGIWHLCVTGHRVKGVAGSVRATDELILHPGGDLLAIAAVKQFADDRNLLLRGKPF